MENAPPFAEVRSQPFLAAVFSQPFLAAAVSKKKKVAKNKFSTRV
jgi:hypothetical protein